MGYDENHFGKFWALLLELRQSRELCQKNTDELCALTHELHLNLDEVRKLRRSISWIKEPKSQASRHQEPIAGRPSRSGIFVAKL
jgi:hypothetical protein